MSSHKNKTFATFIALVAGGFGVHRFYLRGPLDRLGLAHLTSIPIAGLVVGLAPHADIFFKILPIIVSAIVGLIEALTIGLASDEKFDAAYNPASGQRSDSIWVLALILVVTVGAGAVLMIGTLARLFDLLYTGGAYG